MFELLDFPQAWDLVQTAIDNYNEEIQLERFIHTYEPRGMTYSDFKKSLEKTPEKEDHRCAAEILDETAAIFAAAGW